MTILLYWKKYEGPFTLTLHALGLPMAQCFVEKSTAAMWANANINHTQQRIIKEHLWLHFVKGLFIPAMSSIMSPHITMNIGTTKMMTRHRSRNDASTSVMILV
jgi:hypothetical protein